MAFFLIAKFLRQSCLCNTCWISDTFCKWNSSYPLNPVHVENFTIVDKSSLKFSTSLQNYFTNYNGAIETLLWIRGGLVVSREALLNIGCLLGGNALWSFPFSNQLVTASMQYIHNWENIHSITLKTTWKHLEHNHCVGSRQTKENTNGCGHNSQPYHVSPTCKVSDHHLHHRW